MDREINKWMGKLINGWMAWQAYLWCTNPKACPKAVLMTEIKLGYNKCSFGTIISWASCKWISYFKVRPQKWKEETKQKQEKEKTLGFTQKRRREFRTVQLTTPIEMKQKTKKTTTTKNTYRQHKTKNKKQAFKDLTIPGITCRRNFAALWPRGVQANFLSELPNGTAQRWLLGTRLLA